MAVSHFMRMHTKLFFPVLLTNMQHWCLAQKLEMIVFDFMLLISDLAVVAAPAVGAAEAGAPEVVPDPTPGENGSNLGKDFQ